MFRMIGIFNYAFIIMLSFLLRVFALFIGITRAMGFKNDLEQSNINIIMKKNF